MMRTLLSFTALAFALGTTAHAQAPAPAAAYPAKPIRLIVPFPPGGGTDILSRLVATKLTESAKWTVVADNRAGAGGTIGIGEAVKAAPTGYDLVMGQKDNLVIGPWLYKNLSWDPTKDLTPVAPSPWPAWWPTPTRAWTPNTWASAPYPPHNWR